MDESKQEAKAAKKTAKADVKTQKKLTKRTDVPPPSATDASPSSADQSRTAAERSAAAAERQVRLQTYRVWIAVVVGLVALCQKRCQDEFFVSLGGLPRGRRVTSKSTKSS